MTFTFDTGLWPPQLRSIEAAIEAMNRGSRVCLYSPTGSGKTRMAGELLRWCVDQGLGGVFYVNRKLLIQQTVDRFTDLGLSVGIRAAEFEDYFDASMPVQVASADTEASRVYKKGIWQLHDVGPGGLIVVDEAHIQKSKVMQNLLYYYKNNGARILLLTATPVEMGAWADELVVGGKLSEWRSCGALVPVYPFSISQPDMRKIKRNATGEYVLDDKKRRTYMQHIVGEVIENWERLNDGSPTMMYAPGVPESRWLVEQFAARGHKFIHVDATNCVIDGVEAKLTPKLWEEILDRVRSGTAQGLSSRFKLREGVDLPTAGHCVMATPVGSVASYLQIAGRVMRTAPGKTQAILQDHGGCYWTHGSPNHDRPWDVLWKMKEGAASNEHVDSIRNGDAKEPIRCYKCGMERMSGPKCPSCGAESTKSVREIRMEDGTLERIEGDLIKPPRRTLKPDTERLWAKMFWGFRKKGVDKSFAQMEGFFLKTHGYLPPRNLPLMPRNRMDWKLKPKEIAMSDLHSVGDNAKPIERRRTSHGEIV